VAVRDALGGTEFESARAEGQALSYAAAVALAESMLT